MLLRYLAETLSAQAKKRTTKHSPGALIVDELYVVYGMHCVFGHEIEVMVNDDEGFQVPLRCFEIIDGRFSRFWVCHLDRYKVLGVDKMLWQASYPRFVYNNEHRLGVLEGRAEDLNFFREQKELMDLEFPNPAVTAKALHLEGRWVQCEVCCDAWESNGTFALVRCPSCKLILNNPNYSYPGIS